ncbi:MAG: FAD-dependent oxidoreductase [Dehalococcoidia bacterium]|jgi:alkyl hydroperoxide reductase subunit F|nr:FAD-dependent oxidoreductase [Dehalococcoidia bacterium]
MKDLAILGAGPAGMTAAVYAARKKVEMVLVSKDVGGQMLWTLGIENYMGYQYIEAPDLISKFEAQVKQFPIEQRIGNKAGSVKQVNGGFHIEVDGGGPLEAKAVLIATGKRPRQLGVPGEGRLRGRGVSYCAICDGPLFSMDKVVVVGGGNSGLEAVYDLLKLGAPRVTLISNTSLAADEVLIEQVKDNPNLDIFTEHEVVEITGDKRVEGIHIRSLKDGSEHDMEVGAAFVEIGLQPNSELVKGLVDLNSWGEIKVNLSCETNVPGFYAAGDVTDVPEKQIVVAAGEGAKAAIQAQKYLQRLG